MRILSRTLLAAAVTASLLSFANAAEYEYDGRVYTIDIKAGSVSGKMCDGDKCSEVVTTNIEKLIEKLDEQIAESDEMLSNKDGFLARAKELAESKDAIIAEDKSTGKRYVMLDMAKHFKLPLNMDLVKEGNYELVASALQANRDRYARAKATLESGELPPSLKTDSYAKVAEMMELQNIVQFSGTM